MPYTVQDDEKTRVLQPPAAMAWMRLMLPTKLFS